MSLEAICGTTVKIYDLRDMAQWKGCNVLCLSKTCSITVQTAQQAAFIYCVLVVFIH